MQGEPSIQLRDVDCHLHLPGGGELEGVAHEVDDNLAEPRGITHHSGGHRRIDPAKQFQVLLRGPRRKGIKCILDTLPQVKRRHLEVDLPGLDLGIVEDVVDDGQEGVAAGFHRADEFPLRHVERRVLQQARHAQNAVQRRADLMAHRREEGALRLVGDIGFGRRELRLRDRVLKLRIQLFRFVLRRPQAFLRLAAGGDVRPDPGEADKVSCRVAQRLDLQRGPVTATVAGPVQHDHLEARAHREPGSHQGHGLRIRVLAAQQRAGPPPHGILEGIAADPGEAFIHPFDLSRGIRDHDGVRGPRRHQRQALVEQERARKFTRAPGDVRLQLRRLLGELELRLASARLGRRTLPLTAPGRPDHGRDGRERDSDPDRHRRNLGARDGPREQTHAHWKRGQAQQPKPVRPARLVSRRPWGTGCAGRRLTRKNRHGRSGRPGRSRTISSIFYSLPSSARTSRG